MGLRRQAVCFSLLLLSSFAVLDAAPRLRLSQTVAGPIPVNLGADTSVVIDAANEGDGSLALRLTSSVPWLVPTAGAIRDCALRTNACIPVLISVRSSGLTRGMHSGLVTVDDPNALDAPQAIAVVVNVGGNVPERASLFVAPNGSADQVRWNSTTPLNVSAATQSGGSWLAVAADLVGSFRAGVTYRITATHTTGLAEGTYSGQVTVAGSPVSAENRSIPVTLRVTSQPIAQLSAETLSFRIAQGSARQSRFISAANRGLGTLTISGITATTPSGENWLTAERPQNGNVIQVNVNPAGLAPGAYQGTVTIASNAVQGEIDVPVQLSVVAAGPPLAYYNGVVNNATFAGGDVLGRGAIVALFGEQFTAGDPQVASALPLGNELGGARVLVNDLPAPVYYLSYNQINFQIPYDAAPGDAVIRVEREGQRGNGISARIVEGAPRLLRLGIGDYLIAVNQDQSFPIPPTPGVNSRPARSGDTLVIYAIGLGPTAPAVTSGAASPAGPLAISPGDWRVSFGFVGPFGVAGVETPPLFVGLTPNFVGLYQINVTVPADAPRGSTVPLVLIGPHGSSNRVTIAIE